MITFSSYVKNTLKCTGLNCMLAPRSRPLGLVFIKTWFRENLYGVRESVAIIFDKHSYIRPDGSFTKLLTLYPNCFQICSTTANCIGLPWFWDVFPRRGKGEERGPQLDAADIKMREEVKERGRGMDLVAPLQTPYNNLTTTFQPSSIHTTPSQPHYNPHILFQNNQPLPPARCSGD